MKTRMVRLDSAGDVLLAGPAVRAAAAHSDEVVMLCGPRGREAAALLPGLSDLIVWDAPWVGREAAGEDVCPGATRACERRPRRRSSFRLTEDRSMS